MSVLEPEAARPIQIMDLAQEAVNRCENRQDSLDRMGILIRDALIELTTNTDYRDDFDELEIWSESFALTVGVTEYPFSQLVPQTNEYERADYNLATLDILMWIDPPTNTKRIKLNPSHYQLVDRGLTLGNSQPAEWYRFGDSFGVNPAPNRAYEVQARILRGHPINDDAVPFTTILLSRSWHEVLVWAGVERLYMELGQFEKAAYVHKLLHGDPRYPDKPGLLNGGKKRRKREAHRVSGGLRPVIRPYGAR
jgi:hypothetical protein